ncbi:CDP-alcohol phosphatidyltransferase family protein [uncultured Aureimonas sp.]|uniref:CDP-alcohol phosphatidyltransferase family protein n=1 Tax=uncultured Aureimonas sp. TaxID=1604662 RepID=UPI0025F4F115|nr:CDP-alcohol phosphatidyltransferase family protein [uncultured Aureimonas sp.]
MFDHRIIPLQNRVLVPMARVLAKRGVRADALSWTGFGFGVVAFALIWANWYLAGLLAIAANRLVDGLDGSVARATRPTDRGAFLDIVLDFAFYTLVPLAFALADPAANALAAAVLIASFVGTGTSFLAFSLIAERRGLRSAKFPAKGIYYVGALAEGAETIAVFVAMCLVPTYFPAIAYGYAALCAITTALRLRLGMAMLRDG